MPSDDNLPAVPEENFNQKREITIDPYSETISSSDESSDDRTITVTVIVLLPLVLRRHHASGKVIQKELKLPFTK